MLDWELVVPQLVELKLERKDATSSLPSSPLRTTLATWTSEDSLWSLVASLKRKDLSRHSSQVVGWEKSNDSLALNFGMFLQKDSHVRAESFASDTMLNNVVNFNAD